MSLDDAERASARKSRSNRKRRSLLPALLGLLCVGLAAEGIYAALTSPRFQIERVDVRGNVALSSAEILKTAAVPYHKNLFLLNAGKSAARIASLPRIKHVKVHRRLPNRVILHVEEREPVALLAAGTTYYLVDKENIPFARLDRNGIRLPVLRLTPPPQISIGKPLTNEAFTLGMKTLPQIKGTFTDSYSLWVDPRLNLCLNSDDFSVRLGQPDNLKHKLELLQTLLEAEPTLPQQARYLDLSAPEDPALMPREPVVASVSPVDP